MTSHRTVFVVFGCAALLWTFVSQINHYLAPAHLHVFAGGLFVVFASLRLERREAWRAVLLAGLWCDAASPLPFGLHALCFLCAHTFLHQVRSRIPREDTLVGVIAALIVNAALFLAISLVAFVNALDFRAYLARLAVDLILSELVVLLIAPWFLALQERALEITGAGLRRTRRGML